LKSRPGDTPGFTPVDDRLIGIESDTVISEWNAQDSLLYALAVGAGTDDLSFTTDNSAGFPQRALPTMAVIVGQRASVYPRIGRVDFSRLVQAEQSIELFEPLSAQGSLHTRTRVSEVWDKGKPFSTD
jgi:hypothetical protein